MSSGKMSGKVRDDRVYERRIFESVTCTNICKNYSIESNLMADESRAIGDNDSVDSYSSGSTLIASTINSVSFTRGRFISC